MRITPNHYASTSLSCAGIQQWKSVSFCCWAAINLVGEMSNEEQDTLPPTLPTLFLPHCVESSTSMLALDEQWGAEHPNPYPTHPFPSSLCGELCMSDNICVSRPPAVVPAYWDPRGRVVCTAQGLHLCELTSRGSLLSRVSRLLQYMCHRTAFHPTVTTDYSITF